MKTYRLSDHIPYSAFPDAPGPADELEEPEDTSLEDWEFQQQNLEDLFNDLNQMRP